MRNGTIPLEINTSHLRPLHKFEEGIFVWLVRDTNRDAAQPAQYIGDPVGKTQNRRVIKVMSYLNLAEHAYELFRTPTGV